MCLWLCTRTCVYFLWKRTCPSPPASSRIICVSTQVSAMSWNNARTSRWCIPPPVKAWKSTYYHSLTKVKQTKQNPSKIIWKIYMTIIISKYFCRTQKYWEYNYMYLCLFVCVFVFPNVYLFIQISALTINFSYLLE